MIHLNGQDQNRDLKIEMFTRTERFQNEATIYLKDCYMPSLSTDKLFLLVGGMF